MSTARVAIIGLGRMASTIDDEVVGYPAICLPYSVAASCRESDRLELVAGCDLLPERRDAFRERWGIDALYDDFTTMIRETEPDIVAICTKGVNHAELSCAVAELKPKAIYCEKAIACSLEEADAVKDAVGDIPYCTGVLRRYDPRYEVIRQAIAAGAIGQPTSAVHFAPGTLLHSHSHSIDTLLYLLGDPRVARLRGELQPRSTVIEDNRLDSDPRSFYQFETDTGLLCHSIPAGNWEFEITGTEGILRTGNNGADRWLRRKTPVGAKWHAFLPAEPPEPEPASPTLVLFEELAAAALDGAPTREGVAHAHHVTEACFAVAESHRQGGAWLELPLARRGLYVFHI